jgi:hypothetical protein
MRRFLTYASRSLCPHHTTAGTAALRAAPTTLISTRLGNRDEHRRSPASHWVWRFSEPHGGTPAYVTVALDANGRQIVGYDIDEYGLTPEQFILADYYGVL